MIFQNPWGSISMGKISRKNFFLSIGDLILFCFTFGVGGGVWNYMFLLNEE